MGDTKNLLYFGNDQYFVEGLNQKINDLFGESSKIALSNCPQGGVLSHAIQKRADVILIDFSCAWNLNALINEVVELRDNTSLANIYVVALWASEDQLFELNHLFAQGFQYGFLKGGEFEALIYDIFRIFFSQRIDDSKFAKAFKIDKEMSVSFNFSLGFFSREEFQINCKVPITDEELAVNLPMCEGYEIEPARVLGKEIVANKLGGANYLFKLAYPFDGQWSDKNKPYDQRALTRWILHHTNELCDYPVHVYFVSQNVELLTRVCHLKDQLHLGYDFEFGAARAEVLDKSAVLFYDVEKGERALNTLEHLEELIQRIKAIGRKPPIIVVGGCPSTSEALRKVFSYEQIISLQSALSPEGVEGFLLSLGAKFGSQQNGWYCFRSSDPRRLIKVSQTIVITSMTEREISFLSDLELPMTTLIHFHLPTEFYLSVVETCDEPTDIRGKKHYRGVIHSITEDNLRIMRKFVNQMIYSPLKNFSRFEIDLLLSHQVVEDEENESEKSVANEVKESKLMASLKEIESETAKLES